MIKNFQIRTWIKNDFNDVREILKETWFKTYNFIPENDLLTHLENFYSIEKLDELFNNNDFYCYSVESDKKIVGWMKLFNNSFDGNFYLSSLYVLPDYQGIGIGKELMKIAESKASENNYSKIWIAVMEQNLNTFNWYKKLGFNFVKKEPFIMGNTKVNHLIGYKSLKQ